jgi:adhesin/invasin
MRSILIGCALIVALGVVSACDEASPIAPPGTVLTATANPSQVALFGSSTITVLGRKGTGAPLDPGTEIRLSANRGTVPPVILIGEAGAATGTFAADGRSGAATVTATTGSGTVTATVEIQIGQTADSKPSVQVFANPSSITVGGRSTITVLARNSDGTAVANGTAVFLASTLGTLAPAQVKTDTKGQATATLTAGTQAGTASVTAIVGTGDPARTEVTIRNSAQDVSLQPTPATLSPQGGVVTLTCFVSDAQGLALQGAPVTFETDLGSLDATVGFTNSQGVASVKLTVKEQEIGSRTSFNVRAATPRGDGTLLSTQATIRIQ